MLNQALQIAGYDFLILVQSHHQYFECFLIHRTFVSSFQSFEQFFLVGLRLDAEFVSQIQVAQRGRLVGIILQPGLGERRRLRVERRVDFLRQEVEALF